MASRHAAEEEALEQAPLATQQNDGLVSARLAEALLRPSIYWLFHSWRLFGYMFVLPPLLAKQPKPTLLALLSYITVHRKLWWQKSVHKLLGYGASRRHQIVNENAHLISDGKRYLWSLHPHGILADGWHSIIARNLDSFAEDGKGPPGIGRKIALCFAPIISHVPVHQEMYRKRCGAADKKSVVHWWTTDSDPAIIPGGFSESCFSSSSDDKYEYSYIKERKGFVRIAVEEGRDIVPVYTFGVSRMYYSPRILRGWRARFSQYYSVGLVPFFGWMGTSMPLTDETTTVIFPPFESSRYNKDQVDEAHAAYLEHLKTHFDMHKERFGMKGIELLFVGPDFQDDDMVSKSLRTLGIIASRKASSSKKKISNGLQVVSSQVTRSFGAGEHLHRRDSSSPQIRSAL